MVSKELELLIQNTANSIIQNYEEVVGTKYFNGYTCVIHSEIDYQFKEATPFLIEANLLYGAGTKNNDIEDKYSQNFVINIQSEVNGYEKAKTLFNLIFKALTRTYQTLGTYNCKLFLSSPVITNPFSAIESDYQVLMTMNGSLELAENIVLGATYRLKVNNGSYVVVKPRQPYCLKEAMGGIDTKPLNPNLSKFTKSSNQLTINLILLLEMDGTTPQTAHDTLFLSLLSECFGATNNKYTFSCYWDEEIGDAEISNLICVRGQHIYDEATGENVLSLQFRQAT